MKTKLFVAFVLCLVAAVAYGAMTVTLYQPDPGIERITCAFTSAADGSQTQAVTIRGTIMRVVTNPGATAPTDDWDMTLPDSDGVDLFAGQGANRDTANSEHFVPGVPFKDGTTTSIAPVTYTGTATLTIANAGNAKTGTVVIYVQKYNR